MYPGPVDPDLGTFVREMELALRARGHELDLAVLDRRGGGKLRYLETNGILDALLFYAIGVVIYVLMQLRSRSAGVDTKMLFTEIPPD